MSVIVAGSINVDLTFYAETFAREGETVFGTSMKISTGGKGMNQATAAVRAGTEVDFIGSVGDDYLSTIPLAHMKKENIGISAVKTIKNTATGCADIQVNTKTGENRITVISGANSNLTANDVYLAENLFQSCGCVLSQLEIPDDAILAAKELARKYKKPFILNPAAIRTIPERMFDGVDFLTPNETEAAYFSGFTEEEYEKSADALISMGVKTVIITLGSKGSYIKNSVFTGHIPAIPQKAIDTTGAEMPITGLLQQLLPKDVIYRKLSDSLLQAPLFRLQKKELPNPCRKNTILSTFLIQENKLRTEKYM